ncbi:unnamed protein product [Dicrocoelium dendriticum]|nr:unnamed protein product [Dicrocoelium dendriticum]
MSYLGEASPLETYNSLCDRHLVNYFRSARMRKHLIKTGLITKDGVIRPEAEYQKLCNRENQKRALLELISHAIVERSLEVERIRQGKIRRTLEEICKLHRVRRMREERRKRTEEPILMQLVPCGYRMHEKLDPLPSCPSRSSMDRQSQMEVERLRRIYRKQQIKQHKEGQPPYLYLYDPKVSKGGLRKANVTRTRGSKSDRTVGRALSRSRGDAHVDTGASEPELHFSLQNTPKPVDVAPVRSRYKYQEARGDRLNAEEQFITSDDWKSVSECQSGNHSSQSDSAHILSSSLDSAESLNSKRQHTQPTAVANHLLTHLRRCCLSHVRSSMPKPPLFIAPSRSGSATSQIPALVFSVKRSPRAIVPSRPEDPERLSEQRGNVGRHIATPPTDPSKHPFQEVETAVRGIAKKKSPTEFCIPSIKFHSDDESVEPGNFSTLPPIMDRNDVAKSPCVVKFKYLGLSRHEDPHWMSKDHAESSSHRTISQRSIGEDRSSERLITVTQQPSGAGSITVFRGFLRPGDIFEFTSRRAYGHPFSLSLCIDGAQDARISVCCEYRHKRGARIGGKNGHFVYLHVEGSIPCYKCLVAQRMRAMNSINRSLQDGDADAVDTTNRKSVTTRDSPQTGVWTVSEQSCGGSAPSVTFSRACFGTNISRRLTKTTHWECFDSSLTELHCELAKVDADAPNHGLRYGLEQVEDADESHQLSVTNDSSAEGGQSYSGAIQSPEVEHSKSDIMDQDEDVQEVYEDNGHVGGLEDDYGEVEAGVEDENEVVGFQQPSVFEDESASTEMESDCSHMASIQERPRTNRVVIESSLDCRDVVVEKVDAFYQHRMSTAYPIGLEEHEEESSVDEPNLDHSIQLGRLSRRRYAGDAVESLLGCDVYLTDVAEETPLQQCSSDGFFGCGISNASGDKSQPDTFKCASSSIVHSSPPNVRTRIPSVILETEDECAHSCTWKSPIDWPPTHGRIHFNEAELNLSAATTPIALELVTDDVAHASSYLSTLPASSSNWSRTTTTQSVTFVSSFNHSRTPVKQLGEMDADLKPNGSHMRLVDHATPTATPEINQLFSPHSSPRFTRDQISVHGLAMRLECRSADSVRGLSRNRRVHFGENQANVNFHSEYTIGLVRRPAFASFESCLMDKPSETRNVLVDRSVRNGSSTHMRFTPPASSSVDIYETASEATLASPTSQVACNNELLRPNSGPYFGSTDLWSP